MFDIIPPEYFYELPDSRIAQYPLEQRDKSKLLVFRDKKISESTFSDLGSWLPEGSLLVFNNTKVIKARLIFRKDSGARIEIFCLEPLVPAEYEKCFASASPVEWSCLVGNNKKWNSGPLSMKFRINGEDVTLIAELLSGGQDGFVIRFSWDPAWISFGDIIGSAGHIPLPPYIDRNDEISDSTAYQTVYSKVEGSVAAPTAGLHFTQSVIERLKLRGIEKEEVTLHVGAGTFLPVKTPSIKEHKMHAEHFSVTQGCLKKIIEKTGNIIAVGTTSVRTLESLYWMGVSVIENPSVSLARLEVDQWQPYDRPVHVGTRQALVALSDWMARKKLTLLSASTRIIIIPGYRFRVIDGMVTNFHQPGSTLLLLVSAFAGDSWKDIYKYALENDFRFLSYGDSSLLLK